MNIMQPQVNIIHFGEEKIRAYPAPGKEFFEAKSQNSQIQS